MAQQFTSGRFRSFLDSTLPNVGGRLYTYASGTTTHKDAYTDATLTVPCTYVADGTGHLYIALNARGEAQVWLGSGAYTMVDQTALGVTLDTTDGVLDGGAAASVAISAALAASGGSSLVGFIQTGAGAVQRTMQDKGRDSYTSFDAGAKHDGSDDTAAHQAGINACQISGKEYVIMPGASIISTVTTTGSIKIRGHGPNSILRQKVGATGNMINVTGAGTTVTVSDLLLDGQQALQGPLSTNDQIYCSATGIANGKPLYLVVDNVDFVNPAYRGIAFYGDNDDSTREVGIFTRNRFRDGSVNATNTVYTPVDIHLVDGVEAIVDDNDFYFSTAPMLPGGRCAVVVAQTQTTTSYYTKPTITNNRINYRGCNELASLGAIDLYIWSGNAVVSNNTISNSTASAIKLKGNSYDMSVIGNKIDGCFGTGGALATFSAITISNPNYGASASQFLVDANQITNWNSGTSGIISVETYDGAQFSKNVVITKNQLAAVTGIGIDVNNCQDATISGNEIDGRGTVINGIRVLACDGNIRIEKNKVAGTTSYCIYNDTPLTAAQDVMIDDNVLMSANGTYSIYAHCRQALVRKNFLSGGFHGVNFGGGVQSAIALENVLSNMTGTVGIAITSTAVNVVARSNIILDSASITSPFADSSTPTFKVEEGNSWNGQVTWGIAAPTTGAHKVGDRQWNSTPNSASTALWECTATGTPGTFKQVPLT